MLKLGLVRWFAVNQLLSLLHLAQENGINLMWIFFLLQLSQSQSTIISLFYCGVKQTSQLQIIILKESLKKFDIEFNQGSTKDELVVQLLGKFLINEKKVEIIDAIYKLFTKRCQEFTNYWQIVGNNLQTVCNNLHTIQSY